MKLQNHIMFLFVGLSFSLSLISCKQKAVYPNILVRIDSSIAHNPDSALYILDLLDDFMNTQPDEIQVYHCLLKTKAIEECHKPHFSDVQMKRVVKYYQENGSPEKLMEAYFLLACIYRDLNDVSFALEYFQKAVEVRVDNPCHSLKSRAYSQMGILFTNQGMHFEATDVYRKACSHALLGCDSLDIARFYKDLGRNFAMRNKMDSTMKYYDLAGRYDAEGTVQEKIDMYIYRKEFDKARKMLVESVDSYSEWGDYYHGINKRDSASIYYQHALDCGDVDLLQQLTIYRRLALYAEEQGRIMQALMYTKIVNGLLDSLNVNHKLEAEDRMRALYSRYDSKSEKGSRIHDADKDEKDWIVWLVPVVLLIGLVAGIFYKNRKKQLSSPASPKKVLKSLDLPICRMIKINARDPNFKLNDAQWEELKKEMDASLDGFTERLLCLNPKLNDVDIHVCYLLKLGISPSEMAHIMVCQINTVSSIRKRLYKKIHGVEGTPGQLDRFIEEF